jgi:tetratricopeptide (TPR) repeat protein
MMTAYGNLGMDTEADSLIVLLEQLRERMTTMERLSLDWMLGNRTDDPELAEQMYGLDASSVPATYAMITAWRRGRMSDAIERLEHIDLDDSCPWLGRWNQGSIGYHTLGRYAEELALVRHGLGYYPYRRSLMDIEIRAFAGMGRLDAVDSVLNAMAGLPPQRNSDPNLRPLWAGLELRAHGHRDAADRAFQRALEGLTYLPSDQRRNNRGQIFYYTGRWADADTVFASLLYEDPEGIA